MTNENECSICQSISKLFPVTCDGKKLDCPRCGIYSITGTAEAMWKANNPGLRQIANASGWIREHQNINIDSGQLDFLLSIEPPSVHERAVKILIEINKRCFDLSYNLNLKVFDVLETKPWLGISYSHNGEELYYLFRMYLLDGVRYINFTDVVGGNLLRIQITPKGYEFLENLKQDNTDSQIGFCAMWFNKDVLPIWTSAIQLAIKAAGYDAKRIDTHEHNNRIDDEIISMIRRSKFMVADFTGQRGGVYFEAGFALGLGLQVIWTCKKSELENNHLDTRQYNFVTWEEEKLDEFKTNLQNRIEATLGRGTLS